MAAEPTLTASDVARATARALPWLTESMVMPPGEGRRADDSALLDTALARAATRWPDVSDATRATLWWYGSSSTLAMVVAAQLLVTGRSIDPATSVVTVGDTGTVAAVTSTRIVTVVEVADAWADVVDEIVQALVRRTGVSGPSLWAIASDSVANRALDVASALGRVSDATAVASIMTSQARRHRFPAPRFVDVTADGDVSPAADGDPAPRSRRFVRRSSCCLVLDAGVDMCVSCPHRTPTDRAQRWSALVAGSG